jgi:type IV pilus assembly protein PilQ
MLIAFSLIDTSHALAQGTGESISSTEYRGQNISIDLKDASLQNTLRMIADVSGYNIATSSDVQGSVSMRLIDVPWDQVFSIILREHGLYQVTEGNVIIVVPLERVPQLFFSSS